MITNINSFFCYSVYFIGITGNVSIDDNGDRNADYSLLDMNPDTGAFHVSYKAIYIV